MKTLVRCIDKSVFEIDPVTLEAKHCSVYDAYCYSDPEPNVTYIEHSDWVGLRNQQWDKARNIYYRCKRHYPCKVDYNGYCGECINNETS